MFLQTKCWSCLSLYKSLFVLIIHILSKKVNDWMYEEVKYNNKAYYWADMLVILSCSVLNCDSFVWRKIASFRFAWRMILGRVECQFHSCAHASNLTSLGPPSSTMNAMFDVLLSQKPSVMQIESALLLGHATVIIYKALWVIIIF